MTPSSARGAVAAALRLSGFGALAGSLMLGLSACDRSGAPPAADAPPAVGHEAAPSADAASAAAAAAPAPPAAPAPGPAAAATPGPLAAEGAPAFAALYPGAELHEAPGVSATGPAGPGGLVTFVTADAPDAVVAFYRQRAESAGLTSTMAMSQGEARAYGAAQGAEDGASVQVVASPDGEGRTSVQLAWSRGR